MAATKGLKDHLFMAACEWFLMFWMFIHAALSYYLSKFAQYCELQIPCLLCSRIDHFFGNEKSGSYFDLFCNKHQVDISYMIYCNLHNELVDVREMCEDCFNSVTVHSQSHLECFGYRRSYLNIPSRACSCCERQWKEKSSGKGLIKKDENGSRACKVTTKPPLPRVARRGRSRHEDPLKKMRNKIKNRRRDVSTSVGYPDFKFNSDSEFEFLFSDDDDDGSFYVVGIGEGCSNNDSGVHGSTNGVNRYKGLGMHSYSTPDLGTALLLEAQLNESSRTRSASLTPGCSLRKTKERDHLKTRIHKKPSSSANSAKGMGSLSNVRSCFSTNSLDKTNGYGSFDGNHNRHNVFSRHSYSAADLGSALLEIHLNSLPRRSASLTPSNSTYYGLGERNWPKFQTGRTSHSVELGSFDNFQFHNQKGIKNIPSKGKKNRKSSSSTNYVRNSGSSNNLRSDLSTYYMDKTNGYGHFDDSVLSRNTGSHHRHKIPRRHSYSVFQLGCEILLNMPPDESLASRSANSGSNGFICHALDEHNKSQFPTRPSYSPSPEVSSFYPISFPIQKCDVRSDLSTAYTKNTMYGSVDDTIVSRRTGNQHQNNIPRRHSYSFFELGCEILLNMPGDESLISRSVSMAQNSSNGYGLGVPKMSKHQTRPNRNTKKYKKSSFNRANRHGSVDDSILSRNTGGNSKNKNPRRHSYSAFELGSALLLETNMDEGLSRSSASLAPNFPMIHGLGEQNSKFHTRPSSLHPPEFQSRNMMQFPIHKGSQNQNKIPRRHSVSAFDLGCALLLEMHTDESLPRRSASLVPNGHVVHGLGEKKHKIQTKHGPSHSYEHNSLNTVYLPRSKDHKASSFIDKTKKHQFLDDSFLSHRMGHQNDNRNPRRHSHSAFDFGHPLFVEMLLDDSLNGLCTSFAPNHATMHGFEEFNWPHSSELNYMNVGQFHHQKVKRDKKPLPSVKGLGPLSLDDSSISRNKSSHNQSKIPRRHSYSVLQLGGDILLNMPVDESLTSYSISSAPNYSNDHGFRESQNLIFQTKPKHSHSSGTSSSNVMQYNSNSSNDFLGETKWRGSFDDLIVSHSTGNHKQNEVPRRHSYSAFDLGHALLVEMHLDESLKRCHASTTPTGFTGHSFREHNQPHSSDINYHNVMHSHHRKANRDKNLPLPTSGVRTHGHRSLDDSIVSHNTDIHNHNHNKNPRRHSYSAFELGCALMLDMQRDRSSTRRSASLTPSLINYGSEELRHSKMHTKHSNHHSFDPNSHHVMHHRQSLPPVHPVKGLGSTDAKMEPFSTSFYKSHRHGSFDDSIVSQNRDNRKRYRNITRNSYSVSDLTSPLVVEMNLNESAISKSASLTPSCSIGEGLGELNRLKFQIGSSSSRSPESTYHDDMEPVQKRKKVDRLKTIPSVDNVKMASSSTDAKSDLSNVSLDKANQYGFFDDSVGSNDMGSQNRFKIFSRNSQSATDLGSALLEMHLNDSIRSRSKSLTPSCSVEHGLIEKKCPKSQIKHTPIEKTKGQYPLEVENDNKPFHPMNPTKEMDPLTSIKSDLCPTCLDKIDVRSFDGSSVFSEMEVDGCIEKVKRQAEDDVRCMRLLQSELEAERNAATIAANHAMNMITRLQQEKASLQMEALQYLRMMEEQAEYDMEALQKANELVEEKENEIQDLLDELDHYRIKYGDESTRNTNVPVINLEEEKRYILDSLSKLEKKLHQLSSLQSSNGAFNGNKEKLQLGHSNDGNSLSTHKDLLVSNGVHENNVDFRKKMLSNDGIEADLTTMEHEISNMKRKMEALQTEVDLLKHACNTLHGNDGFEFIQEIAHQLQDLRKIMFDRRYISSN